MGKHLVSCYPIKSLTKLIPNEDTTKVNCFRIPETNVYLMDTPGFDDTNISDADILKEIATALVDAFNDKVEIQGALYVHPVIEARMRGSGRKNLIMFTKVLGMHGMKNCRLVTTKWSKVDYATGVDRETELCEEEKFWRPLLNAGASTVRFQDTTESAIEIIKPLVHGQAMEPQLVKEVVREGRSLKQTSAGQIVNEEVLEAKKAHAAEIEQLKKDIKDAIEKKEFEFADLLKAERDEHAEKLEKLKIDSVVLDKKVSGLGKFTQWALRTTVASLGVGLTVASGGWLAPVALLYSGATEAAINDFNQGKTM